MSATDVEAKVGDYTVTLYNRISGLIHSVHSFVGKDVTEVVDLAKEECQKAVDPTGNSTAHIGYTDGLIGSVTDTASGEGVNAPRDKTDVEKLMDKIAILEENQRKYQEAESQRTDAYKPVQAPQPFQGSGQGLPLSPSTTPGQPVDAPSPNVNDGPTIPAAPPFQGPEA